MKINEKSVKSFWDKRARLKKYKNYASITQFDDTEEGEKRNEIELEQLKNLKIQKNSIALDIGCGTGRYSKILSKKCKKVYALDYSKPMIDLAKKINSEKNINYICIDATKFIKNIKFDLILVTGVFIFLNNDSMEKIISNVSKMLKKEGKVFVRGSVGIKERFELIDKYSNELKTNYNAIYRTPEEHHKIFVKYGLIPIEEKLLYQFRKETAQMQFIYMRERVVGILGGMGPYASLDVYKKILDNFKTEKDWEYPRLLIDSNTKIPSRTRAILYSEESPEKYLEKSIENLGKIGADIVVIACNSAHYFLKKKTKTPIKNIIEIVYEEVKKDNIEKVGLIAGTVTVNKKLYENIFKDIKVITLPEYQDKVIYLIDKVKKGTYNNKDKILTKEIIDALLKKGCKKIILGCTELPFLYKSDITYDVNDILSKYIIKYAKREI